MRKALGIFCMILGLAMIACAGLLIYGNQAEEDAAGESATLVLEQLVNDIVLDGGMTVTQDGQKDELILPEPTPVPEMATMEIDGEQYIGYLEMPSIGLKLPVMSEWRYARLRTAPCRYRGSVYDGSLVIMAHNYERHFGLIGNMNIGDPVQFVDAQGVIHKYIVAAQETLERYDTLKMVDSEYDLTLFTCTYGGAKRVTVRLNSVLAY